MIDTWQIWFHGCDISVVMFWEGCITILLAYDKDIVSLLTPPHTGSTPTNPQPHPTPNPLPPTPTPNRTTEVVVPPYAVGLI